MRREEAIRPVCIIIIYTFSTGLARAFFTADTIRRLINVIINNLRPKGFFFFLLCDYGRVSGFFNKYERLQVTIDERVPPGRRLRISLGSDRGKK